MSLELDTVDCAILRYLQAEAKMTNAQLAQEIGLSPASTLERVRKLEGKGIIKSYHARLAHEKLGLHIHIIMQAKLYPMTAAHLASFQKAIRGIPEIVACHQVIGAADFVLQVITTDLETYQQCVVQRLSIVEGLQCLPPLIATATLKEDSMPALPISS